MNKIILSLIIILSIAVGVYPVTVDIPTCGVKTECHVDTLRDSYTPAYTDPMNWMRIVFNIPCYDDGTNPYLTATQISDVIDSINGDFDSTRINFNYSIHWVYSTFICTTQNVGSVVGVPTITSTIEDIYFSSLDSQLNIFVCGGDWLPPNVSAQASGAGGGVSPYGTNYRLFIEASAISGDLQNAKSTLAHEIGHVLGLHHPFEWIGNCSNECREFSLEYWVDTLGLDTASATDSLNIKGDAMSDLAMNGSNEGDTAWVDSCSQGANVAATSGNYMNWRLGSGWHYFSDQQKGCMLCVLTDGTDANNLNQWVGTAP